jgi:hypothetical protein
MPFPYAYYKEIYDGPIEAEKLTAKALFLKPPVIITTGGNVNINDISHIYFDTTAGNITVDSFINGKVGQVLFLYKNNTANTVTIKYNSGGTGKIFNATKQDLVFGAGLYGGTVFVCRDGDVWHQMDSNGLLADGTVAAPSISFASDPDTGLYHNAANSIGITTGGVARMYVNTTDIQSLFQHKFVDGTVTAPGITFLNDVDTGLFRSVTGLSFAVDGLERLRINLDGSLTFPSAILKAEVPFQLFTAAGTAQNLNLGALQVSNAYGTYAAQVPVNGIFSLGNIKTNGQFQGTATSALFADVAEKYKSDADYPSGTVVMLGGSEEITSTKVFADTEVFGVISTNPALRMNDAAGEGYQHVALLGRVPCRVTGKVKKFERLISSSTPGVAQGINGVIMAIKPSDLPFIIVGRALEAKDTDGEGLVEIAIGGSR